MVAEQEVDHIKGYRGRVVVLAALALESDTYKGRVLGRDPKDDYVVSLDTPARITRANGSMELIPELHEESANLIKLRRPKNVFERRVLARGYEPGEYALIWTTWDGQILPGGIESFSGHLITMEPKVFVFAFGRDKLQGRNDLIFWEEDKLSRRWLKNKEVREAFRTIHWDPKKLPPEIFVGYKGRGS